jgi:hypothetical protein
MRVCKGRSDGRTMIFRVQAFIGLGILIAAASSCGAVKTNSSPVASLEPVYSSNATSPNYWSPSSSPLPARPPRAAALGVQNFPLTVSSPADGASVMSLATVIASANPKNPIFFMHVNVDQLAVYYTFTCSISAQIFIRQSAVNDELTIWPRAVLTPFVRSKTFGWMKRIF